MAAVGANCVIDAVVDVLLVVLGTKEKEHLVTTPVEARVWQDHRTPIWNPWIKILRLGPRNI